MAEVMAATTNEAASSPKTSGSPMPSRSPERAGPTITPTWKTIWVRAAAAARCRRSTMPGTAAERAVLEKPKSPAASALTT